MLFVDTNSHLTAKLHNLTSSVKAILKAMTNTGFLGPSVGVVSFLNLRWKIFLTRESALGLTGWTLFYPFGLKGTLLQETGEELSYHRVYIA